MADENEIHGKIDMITSAPSRDKIQATIAERSIILKQLSEDMWQDINALINAEKIKESV